ncbi:hydantoinase B/oxoprolinase family protein [Microbaculum marinum]|uniref:Hydantoinase B/oxoprolinase family protein n=1 Tax=Microbaculum marinum TaxID=1764581 RepID=A0AAW9RN00_9HYPH
MLVAEKEVASIEIDPVTLEVIRNRLNVVADEMESILLRSSFSAIMKEALDGSTAIFDAGGNTIAQASAIPVHLGSLIPAVRKVIELFEGNMVEGDIFCLNDPYKGGTHLPDINVICPVFHDGVPIAYSASIAHKQDIGGRVPGSTPPDSTELFAEGLIIPPMKLFKAGERNEDLFEMIASNVRVPEGVVGDIEAQVACCLMGRRRILELVDEVGHDRLVLGFDHLQDHAERLTREALAKAPPGPFEFSDYLDDNGIDPHTPVKIAVKLSFEDGTVIADFTGTDPQARGALNCVPSTTLAAVYFAIRAVCVPQAPKCEGVHRAIRTIFPEGTIVNASFPAPVAARTITVRRIVSVMMGALAQAFPGRVPAACDGQSNYIYVGGSDPKVSRKYVSMLGVPTSGGMGGRPGKDGVDVISSDASNIVRYPVEAFEADTPFRVKYLRLWQDSGGPGRYRGGLGYHSEIELLRGDAVMTHRRDRHDFAPWGLDGGTAAPCCRTILHRGNGDSEDVPSKFVTGIAAGDRIEIFTTGGGGYGDPLQRPFDAVLADVRSGRVSAEKAASDYGVVIVDGAVAEDASRELRDRLSRQRPVADHRFDRGPEYAERLALPRYE